MRLEVVAGKVVKGRKYLDDGVFVLTYMDI